MSRFPILNGIRILLYILAALTLIGGCIISLGFAQGAGGDEYDSDLEEEVETAARVGAFIASFIFTIISSISLVVMAESIKLGLYIEDHLYNIRYNMTSSRSSNPFSVKQE